MSLFYKSTKWYALEKYEFTGYLGDLFQGFFLDILVAVNGE